MARSALGFDPLAALPKSWIILWKAAAELCLVIAVFITAHSKVARKISLYVFLIFMADIILALGFTALAGALFALAHLYVVFIYFKLSPPTDTPPRLKAISYLPLIAVAALCIYLGLNHNFQLLALFPAFSALAALAALRSRYPKLLTGLGAVIFWMSDMVFVLAVIFTGSATSAGWMVWLTFSSGLLLMTLGFIRQHSSQDTA